MYIFIYVLPEWNFLIDKTGCEIHRCLREEKGMEVKSLPSVQLLLAAVVMVCIEKSILASSGRAGPFGFLAPNYSSNKKWLYLYETWWEGNVLFFDRDSYQYTLLLMGDFLNFSRPPPPNGFAHHLAVLKPLRKSCGVTSKQSSLCPPYCCTFRFKRAFK